MAHGIGTYDNPFYVTYSVGEHDFGAGGESLSIKGPSGKKGRLKFICLSATEAFTADTTSAKVQIGTAADVDAYAQLDCATTADTDSIEASDEDTGTITDPDIPADTQVEVTLVAPTGGTPAGKGFVNFVIGWY